MDKNIQKGFQFHRPTGQVNWKQIHKLDLDSLVESTHVDQVEGHLSEFLEDVLYGVVEESETPADPALVKAYQTAQLSAQYLAFCQGEIDQYASQLQSQIEESAEHLKELHGRFVRRRKEKAKLRKQIVEVDDTIDRIRNAMFVLSPDLLAEADAMIQAKETINFPTKNLQFPQVMEVKASSVSDNGSKHSNPTTQSETVDEQRKVKSQQVDHATGHDALSELVEQHGPFESQIKSQLRLVKNSLLQRSISVSKEKPGARRTRTIDVGYGNTTSDKTNDVVVDQEAEKRHHFEPSDDVAPDNMEGYAKTVFKGKSGTPHDEEGSKVDSELLSPQLRNGLEFKEHDFGSNKGMVVTQNNGENVDQDNSHSGQLQSNSDAPGFTVEGQNHRGNIKTQPSSSREEAYKSEEIRSDHLEFSRNTGASRNMKNSTESNHENGKNILSTENLCKSELPPNQVREIDETQPTMAVSASEIGVNRSTTDIEIVDLDDNKAVQRLGSKPQTENSFGEQQLSDRPHDIRFKTDDTKQTDGSTTLAPNSQPRSNQQNPPDVMDDDASIVSLTLGDIEGNCEPPLTLQTVEADSLDWTQDTPERAARSAGYSGAAGTVQGAVNLGPPSPQRATSSTRLSAGLGSSIDDVEDDDSVLMGTMKSNAALSAAKAGAKMSGTSSKYSADSLVLESKLHSQSAQARGEAALREEARSLDSGGSGDGDSVLLGTMTKADASQVMAMMQDRQQEGTSVPGTASHSALPFLGLPGALSNTEVVVLTLHRLSFLQEWDPLRDPRCSGRTSPALRLQVGVYSTDYGANTAKTSVLPVKVLPCTVARYRSAVALDQAVTFPILPGCELHQLIQDLLAGEDHAEDVGILVELAVTGGKEELVLAEARLSMSHLLDKGDLLQHTVPMLLLGERTSPDEPWLSQLLLSVIGQEALTVQSGVGAMDGGYLGDQWGDEYGESSRSPGTGLSLSDSEESMRFDDMMQR